MCEAVASADLGNSSNYLNELHAVCLVILQDKTASEALKIVVGKVFLRVALM